MGFQLLAREIDSVVVVDAVGKFNLTDGQTQLRDLIHASTGDGAKRFVLNLERVELIDSYGIGELARSYSVVRRMGGEMKLTGVRPRVLEVLKISRMTTVFEIHEEEGAALRAFAASA